MKTLPVILLLLLSSISYAQEAPAKKNVKRWPIWFTPSKADVINGITLSPTESHLFFKNRQQQFNGLVIHGIGVMILGPLIPSDPNQTFVKGHQDLSEAEMTAAKLLKDRDSTFKGADCNGIMISGSGSFTREFNGVNISPFCGINIFSNGFFLNCFYNINYHLNGVAIAVFSNSSFEVRGIQIGLINETYKLVGIQIGLWNVHKDRKLPIVNWNFKRKDKAKES